ncbi:MAG: flavin-dependent monooxygenase [Ilumatobacteraceae bacterium]|nr:flavin-dependent monooxygenase [Ilumatobacteraceae bacterium]
MSTVAHEVLDRVRELAPKLRERGAAHDDARRLVDQTVSDLRDSGVMRLMQPARYGGYEADPLVFYECVLAIAAADGASGWVTGVVGVHPWQLALCDDRLQHEIWGADPDTWVSSTYMPGGLVTAADDGYRLSGRWRFSSGSDLCSWVILGTVIQDANDEFGLGPQVILPRSDYAVVDTWRTMGLRGTGSNDIVVDDAFIPSYRTVSFPSLNDGTAPGRAGNPGPLYGLTFGALFANSITAPIIGMAEGMVAEAVDFYRTRQSMAFGKTLDTDPYTMAAIGDAAREVDACRLLLMRDVGEMYEGAQAGTHPSMDDRIRARRDQVAGGRRALRAIDELFDRAGAGAIFTDSPMQRLFRDAHAARHHTALTPLEPALSGWARHAMGLGPAGDPLA